MSVRDWKSFVNSSVYREVFLQLQVELSINRKTSHLSYSKLCTKDYLKQLPPSFARAVFRVKTKMLDIKQIIETSIVKIWNVLFVCLKKHLATFSLVGLGLEFPNKLNNSGYSPLGQKFYCQFLKSLGSLLRDT